MAKPVSSCLIHACSSAGLFMALIHSGHCLFTVERYSASSRIYSSTKPCQSSRKWLQQCDQCRIVSIVRRYVERETSVSNGSGTMPFSARCWCIEQNSTTGSEQLGGDGPHVCKRATVCVQLPHHPLLRGLTLLRHHHGARVGIVTLIDTLSSSDPKIPKIPNPSPFLFFSFFFQPSLFSTLQLCGDFSKLN